MAEFLFPEWRDQTAGAKYPMTDTSTLRSVTGLALPPAWLLDASIQPVGGVGRLYLSKLTVSSGELKIEIGDDRSQSIATGFFSPLDPKDGLALYDIYGRNAGILVISVEESLALLAGPAGEHRFQSSASSFVPSVCCPVPVQEALAVLLEDGTAISGELLLVGEDGVVLRLEDGKIRVDVVGDPLFKRRLCGSEVSFQSPKFIKTINNVPISSNGSFHLSVGDRAASGSVLRIYPSGGKLIVEAVGQSS
jgi:hypothetical protein